MLDCILSNLENNIAKYNLISIRKIENGWYKLEYECNNKRIIFGDDSEDYWGTNKANFDKFWMYFIVFAWFSGDISFTGYWAHFFYIILYASNL